MATDTTRPASGRLLVWAALFLIAAGAGAAGFWWVTRSKPTGLPPDMIEVLRINNRGVGHIERFEFEPAVNAFEEVVQLAPDWLPGRINLGIGLMNLAKNPSLTAEQREATFNRAQELFGDVLARDSNNTHAHYCLGLIYHFRAKPNGFEKSREHFTAVTEIDPTDATAWYWLGAQLDDEPAKALKCFQRAVELDPYENAALYNLQSRLRLLGEDEKAKQVSSRTEDLRRAAWFNPIDPKYYSDVGHYALVIGHTKDHMAKRRVGPVPLFQRHDKLKIQLATETKWAKSADLGGDLIGELRRQVRARFGAVMVVLDYNGDGRPDLFLLGAVLQGGQVRDLLLRNDGDGRFTDVTTEVGLGGTRPSLGCTAADFDNDGTPDLFITGVGKQWLFRNVPDGKGGRKFEDVTAEAGLDTLKTVCLGAAFVDLDQDGDLDLIVAQYADSAENTLKALKGATALGDAGLAVYYNLGEAPPETARVDPPPLKPAFRRMDGPAELLSAKVHAVNMAVTDLDQDFDLDVLVLADNASPAGILNDRLLQFHRITLPETLLKPGTWNGALVFDANHDERTDLFFVGPGKRPVLLIKQPSHGEKDVSKWFQPGAVDSPALLQALAIDVDLDGWTDVVGLSEQHKPVFLQNDGHERMVERRETFGRDQDWPADLVALTLGDFSGKGLPDLVVWSESQGLILQANQGNDNHALQIVLSGHRHTNDRGTTTRCTADGFGAFVMVHSGDHWTAVENTSLSAGLGQSRQPLWIGMGRHTEADVTRVRWPDLCWQAEFNEPTAPAKKSFRIEENNRKEISCPILFTWNGERFVFVTDFLGAGSVGETQPDGSQRLPRPEESVKIEPHQLAPLDGRYMLKLAEPMDEVTYLDRLQLVVVDHPADMRVYPDERFCEASPPTQDLLAFRQEIFPLKARDHRGRDVTAKLRQWDRDTVRDFARRTWIGFAEEHWVELDFGDRLAKFGPNDQLVLCLAGWTDYPYPESIWAATQAGVPLVPPVLERLGDDGKWQTLIADAGFPAGLPRMMTVDVTGKLGGPRCVVRLRTSMTVYWDQIFVAPVIERIPARATTQAGKERGVLRTTSLEVADATLSARGCMQEFSPDGREPTIFDYDRLAAVPVSRLAGPMTRYGDVTELLRDRDDCFVIFGPGDELTVRFDARKLPELPTGWKRSFVLRTWGYCKDCAPFTATGGTIEPLPFEKMSNYPYGPNEHYPNDRIHEEYLKQYQTRIVGPRDRARQGKGR